MSDKPTPEELERIPYPDEAFNTWGASALGVDPLAASFMLPAGTEASVQTRVKMGQTSDVYALVKVGGKFLMTKKEIKVTLGGCGG